MTRTLRGWYDSYERSMQTHPLTTNMASALGLGIMGDVLCQKVVERKEVFDFNRCCVFSSFCCLYQGNICYNVYSKVYPWLFPGITNLSAYALRATLADNLVHVPFSYIPCFFVWMNMLQGGTWKSTLEAMENEYATTVMYCVALWLPIQFINFRYVPKDMQTLFVCTVCLFWNVVLDYVAGGTEKPSASPEAPAAARGSEM